MNNTLAVFVGLLMLLLLFWAHHMFMSGVNPFVSNFFILPIIFLIGIVYLAKRFGGYNSNNVVRLFGIGFFVFLILGAFNGFFWGNTAVDIQFHDTYLVFAHFQLLILISLIFGLYAIAYYSIPKLIKRKLNRTLGHIHFWTTTIGVVLFLYPIGNLGMVGVPRRYYNFENLEDYNHFANMNQLTTIITVLLLLAQCIFIVNVIFSILSKPKNQE